MKELVGKGKPFYSAVDKAAGLLKRKVGTGAEFMKELMALQGIKQSEIAERGLGDVMGMPKMTHEQFMQALAAKPAPAIQEKVFSDKPEPLSMQELRKEANNLIRERAREYASEGSDTSGEYRRLAADEMQRLRRNHMGDALRISQENQLQNFTSPFHGKYTLPGGENYREMLIKVPEPKDNQEKIMELEVKARRMPMINSTPEQQAELTKLFDQIDQLKAQEREQRAKQFGGVDIHFGGEPNILASMRLKDRLGPNGEKLLHLEELQSDWHQQGREHGYRTPESEKEKEELKNQINQLQKEYEAGNLSQRDYLDKRSTVTSKWAKLVADVVPDAPFKKNWEEMALKRLIHHAAEKGYHGIVVTPGAEQADRYSLAKHIDELHYNPQTHRLIASNQGRRLIDEQSVPPEKLVEHVGKEAASKVMEQEPNINGLRSLKGEQLQIGGEGMKGFYDKKVPNILNAIGKKYGVKTALHGHKIETEPKQEFGNDSFSFGSPAKTATVHHFPITEEMRKDVLANGLPLHREGGIIHKAVGGQVQPSINQMRAELAKKMPTSLADLSSIGANEAPSMNVKAYVPPARDGQLPVGGVSMGDQPLPIGGIDMSRQQGQQLLPANLVPPQGQQPQQGAPSPLSAGAPAQQPPSNILQMTPQGQALNAMSPPQPTKMADGGGIPMTYKVGGSDNMPEPDASWHTDDGEKTFNIDNLQQLAKGGKIAVRPTVFDDAATRRNEKIEAAARALIEGEMKQKAYAKLVAKEKPVKPYDFIPAPATDEQAMDVLIDRQKQNWRSHNNWPAGHRVGLRLDIPAYERHGVWVNSIHDESGGQDKFPTSYGPVSAVRNATFEGSPHKAIRVATGEQNKTPFARIKGELEHMTEEEAIKHFQKYFRHKDYRQIGYDPRRHGDFYDRETMEPVTHAEHVVQIGPLVLAKKPKYGKRELYAKGGSAQAMDEEKKPKPTAEERKEIAKKWAGQLHYESAPSLTRKEIESLADRMVAQILGVDNPHNKTKQQLEREKTLVADIQHRKMKNIPDVDYSKLKNAWMVGIPGDPTIGGVIPLSRMKKRFKLQMPSAGATLNSIDKQALESPVPLYGGTRYGAYGGPNGWASDLGASRGLFNVVQKLHEEDPSRNIYGNTHRMSNESINHAVHMLDSAISHMRPHARPKEHIDYLNDLIRNVRTSTNEIGDVKPHFVGFENPNDLMLQASMDAKLRKKILNVLGTNKHYPGGKQMIDDIYFAISHPELRNLEVGTAGHGVLKFDPTRKLENEISQHPTYAHDIPSELIGKSRYPIPLSIAAPRSMNRSLKKAKEMGLQLAQPFNDMSRSIIREPIDEQYINQLGEYERAMKKRLGYKKGGKVKVSTNMDTINLELSRRTKKAK